MLSVAQVQWLLAAKNSATASRLTLWFARMFGRRIEGTDGEHSVIGYQWRGKLYMTDWF